MTKTTIPILILLVACIAAPPVLSADTKITTAATKTPVPTTTAPVSEIVENITVVKAGNTTIADALATKATAAEKIAVLVSAAKSALEKTEYPYSVNNAGTNMTILKYRCTSEMCGYWIHATRGKDEIATNSPIWISPPPYQVVSETTGSSKTVDALTTVEKTITITEDPKAAAEQILMRYVDDCPAGQAVTGTKE